MLGQRSNASEANSQASAESINKTQDELLRDQARNEAPNKNFRMLSFRSNQPRPIRMDHPKFDGIPSHYCPLVVISGPVWMAQLIEDETRILFYAISNLRGKASERDYSSLMADAKAFPT